MTTVSDSPSDIASAEAQPSAQPTAAPAEKAGRRPRNLSRLIDWLGLLPFLAFVGVFLVAPIVVNVWTSLTPKGSFSFDAIGKLFAPQYVDAFASTINLSVVTAVAGGILGLVLAWALVTADRPRWLRSLVLSFSALASQMGGVPLAFAFIAAVGAQGSITVMLRDSTGWDLSDNIRLSSFWGLALVYLYFQVPLMTVLILPAFGALKKQWSEAAMSLGASRFQYLRDVVVPIMWPAVAGSLLLLFANSFSAYATAYALGGSQLNLVPMLIGFFVSGNVMLDESFGAALVTGMIAIVVAALSLRSLLERKSRRWLS